MSTVLDRTAADTIIEQAVAHAEVGKNFFLSTFKFVPEEKLNWSPAPTAKTPLRIAAHVALGNTAFASIIRGEKPPFPSMDAMFAAMDKSERQVESRIEVLDRIDSSWREVRSAIEALDPEDVAGMVDAGLIPPVPMTFFMFLPGTHMAEHSSQLDYLQTMWGDLVHHFLD